MDRRTALKQLTAAGVGITMLQACNFEEERLPVALNNLKINIQQQDLMSQIVDAIIPADIESDIPGALALEADKFVWVMADDCLSESDQTKFMSGLMGFSAFAREVTGTEFNELEQPDRSLALQSLTQSEMVDVPSSSDGQPLFVVEEVKGFIRIVKQWTMTGFMQSQHIMDEVMPYKLVPQYFHGCVDTDPAGRININA